MRVMYDSVNPAVIPTSAPMVAGYINGTWKWPQWGWDRFPNAIKVRIATRANVNDGHVLDVEDGAALPSQAPGWVTMRRAAGIIPSVYCNQLHGWLDVRKAFWNAKVAEPPYWVARYDNDDTIPIGAVAKQYANPPVHGTGHFDLSVVADYWPGIDQEQPVSVGDTVIMHMASRLYQALQVHHSIDPADKGGVGESGEVAPGGEALELIREIDDAAWRLHSFLQLKEVTGGGTEGVAGIETLPFVTAFKELCSAVAGLRAEVTSMRADLSELLHDGLPLEADGTITIRPRRTD